MLRRYETLYVQESMGLMEAWSTRGFKNSLEGLLTHKAIREWWAGSDKLFSPDFSDYATLLMEIGEQQESGHGIVEWNDESHVRYENAEGVKVQAI